MVRSYRELAVWLEGMNLVTETYRLSRQFPTDERFGLTSQMRRSAVSIPAKIAEGHGRSHRGDFLHHVSFARGLLAELETHCLIAVRLGFVGDSESETLLERCDHESRMLTNLRRNMR